MTVSTNHFIYTIVYNSQREPPQKTIVYNANAKIKNILTKKGFAMYKKNFFNINQKRKSGIPNVLFLFFFFIFISPLYFEHFVTHNNEISYSPFFFFFVHCDYLLLFYKIKMLMQRRQWGKKGFIKTIRFYNKLNKIRGLFCESIYNT